MSRDSRAVPNTQQEYTALLCHLLSATSQWDRAALLPATAPVRVHPAHVLPCLKDMSLWLPEIPGTHFPGLGKAVAPSGPQKGVSSSSSAAPWPLCLELSLSQAGAQPGLQRAQRGPGARSTWRAASRAAVLHSGVACSTGQSAFSWWQWAPMAQLQQASPKAHRSARFPVLLLFPASGGWGQQGPRATASPGNPG